MACHARDSVDLQHQGLAVRSRHKIDSSPAGASEFFECRDRKTGIHVFLGIVSRTLANVLSAIGFIFGAVVVEDTRRDNADTGKSPALQYGDGKFVTFDATLEQSGVAKLQCHNDCVIEVCALEDFRHTNAGALSRRLDDQRKA